MIIFLLSSVLCFCNPDVSLTRSTYSTNIDHAAEDTLLQLAKDFLLAKERSYQQNASEADVVAVLEFCSDSIRYDHVLSPERTFTFNGKELWKKGAISHLGETRNASIKLLKIIRRQNVVIIEFSLYREVKSEKEWKNSTGTTVSIIEFDKAKKIKVLTDYL